MHYSIAYSYVPLLLINHGFAEWILMSGSFYAFTFARSLPNVTNSTTVCSCTYLNGELNWRCRRRPARGCGGASWVAVLPVVVGAVVAGAVVALVGRIRRWL